MHASSRCLILAAALLAISVPAVAQNTAYPSETPAHFKPTTVGFEYERRDVMIPMRDGVKLHTVILVPKGARNAPDPAHSHAVQRHRAHHARAKLAPRPNPLGL